MSCVGCANCKKRRIKCNEELPVCGQCTKSNLKCSYSSLSDKEIESRKRNKLLASSVNDKWKVDGKPGHVSTQTPPSTSNDSNGGESPGSNNVYHYRASSSHSSINLPPIQHLTSMTASSGLAIPISGTAMPPTPPFGSYNSSNYMTTSPVSMSSPAASVSASSSTSNGNLPSISSLSIFSDTEIPTSASKLKIVQHGFETDVMRSVYMMWMCTVIQSAYEHTALYHAVMAFSYGFLAVKEGDGDSKYKYDADKHRFIALQELQEELGKSAFNQTDALLATSLVLSWDFFFQDQNISSYITLSKGLAAVLEKVQLSVATATASASCMSDALFQSMKAINLPRYDPTFVKELGRKIESIGDFIASSKDNLLIEEHKALKRMVDGVSEFLDTHVERKVNESGASYYPPTFLFKLLWNWLRSFPSHGLYIEPKVSNKDQLPAVVLYTYYHAVTRALDALFPEVRYLFQFGFIGPVDLVGIENSVNSLLGEDYGDEKKNKTELEYPISLLNYPLKVLEFFKERLFLLNRLLISDDPLHMLPKDSIKETCVTSFDNADIGAENFPTLVSDDEDEITNAIKISQKQQLQQQQQESYTALINQMQQSPLQLYNQFPSPPLPPPRQDTEPNLTNVNLGSSSITTSARVSPGVMSHLSSSNSVFSTASSPASHASSAGSAYGMEVFKLYFYDRMEILQHV